MSVKIDMVGVKKMFDGMISRANLSEGWLNRVAYPMLLKVQQNRWQTEGLSEGAKWEPLTESSYARSKTKRFADYPGGGRKLLIATGRLAYSMTLAPSLRGRKSSDDDHVKMVRRNRLEMHSLVPYARFVQDQGRDITILSDATVNKIAKKYQSYIAGAKR